MNKATGAGVLSCQGHSSNWVRFIRFDSAGNLQGSLTNVTNQSSWYDSHLVSMNDCGEFVVVASRYSGSPAGTQAFFYSANGTLTATRQVYAGAGQYDTTRGLNQVMASSHSGGGFLLPWLDGSGGSRTNSSAVTLYTASGTKLTSYSHSESRKLIVDGTGKGYYLKNWVFFSEGNWDLGLQACSVTPSGSAPSLTSVSFNSNTFEVNGSGIGSARPVLFSLSGGGDHLASQCTFSESGGVDKLTCQYAPQKAGTYSVSVVDQFSRLSNRINITLNLSQIDFDGDGVKADQDCFDSDATKTQSCEDHFSNSLNSFSSPSPSCKALLQAGNTQSGIYFIQPTSNDNVTAVYCEQEFDQGGYMLITSLPVNTSPQWSAISSGMGDLSGASGEKLDDAFIHTVWGLASSDKRMLVRCSDDSSWGSATANNWYAGSFNGNYRSNCGFSYGATIMGYGSGWYLQNGNGQCLHGNHGNMGISGNRCPSGTRLEFLIK